MTAKAEAFADLCYPATRHAPAPVVDRTVGEDRSHLSRAAALAYLNIMRQWAIDQALACRLLGGIAPTTLHAHARDPDLILDQDRLTRISYLIGIFKALHVLHDEELADRWVTLPNRNRLFGGRSPLDYMLQGGIPAMRTVSRLLDAAAAKP